MKSARHSQPNLGLSIRYLAAISAVALCLAVTIVLEKLGLSTANIVMFFVLVVAIVAARLGTGPSIVASVSSAAALAYYFLPPLLSFLVADVQHIIMLIVMCLIALLVSRLTDQVRGQAKVAEVNARRAESLYRLGEELAKGGGRKRLAEAAAEQIHSCLRGCVVLFLRTDDTSTEAHIAAQAPQDMIIADYEIAALQKLFLAYLNHSAEISPTVTPTEITVPLQAGNSTVGLLHWKPANDDLPVPPDQFQLLLAFGQQVAAALERDRLSSEVREVEVRAERDRLRAALLSSVTHDLRTPLAVIVGASSSLIASDSELPATTRRNLCDTIFQDALRMSRLVDSLLTMTRVEAGCLRINKQMHFVDEVIGAALRHLRPRWNNRPVRIEIPEEMSMVPMDDVLIQQALVNIFENIQKYTPADSAVLIQVQSNDTHCSISITDSGPGIPIGDEERIFEKFFRGRHSQQGSGLGLTICRAVATAHAGTISARNVPDGIGLEIRLELPIDRTCTAPSPSNDARSAEASFDSCIAQSNPTVAVD